MCRTGQKRPSGRLKGHPAKLLKSSRVKPSGAVFDKKKLTDIYKHEMYCEFTACAASNPVQVDLRFTLPDASYPVIALCAEHLSLSTCNNLDSLQATRCAKCDMAPTCLSFMQYS